MTPAAIRNWLRGTVRFALDYPDEPAHWWMVGYVYRQALELVPDGEPCRIPGCDGTLREVARTDRDRRRGVVRKQRCRCGHTVSHLGPLPRTGGRAA